ncbi:MAG: deoxyribodipyrimidine photo-lyase [Thermoleophilia bacterium]|nr:deoxyribodipyrimidine photo-lyase [Thermoleophilia bacterium]
MSACPTVVWFRRDLRTADNTALARACADGPVVCVWVRDPALLRRRHHRAPGRLAFLRDGLRALDADLRARGSRLVVRTGAPEAVLADVCRTAGARRVVHAAEVSPWGRARDRRVAAALARDGVRVDEVGGDLLVDPGDLPGSSGEGYRVFTPFWRAWRTFPLPRHSPAPERVDGPRLDGEDPGDVAAGDPPAPAGASVARDALVRFIRDGGADGYADTRDDPAADATSHLGAYLRLGMCTAAQVGRALGLPGVLSAGREEFWRQIAWREFFHHLMARRPGVARAALDPALRGVAWDDDPDGLDAWRRGLTGYPLVDAGMRQLAATGFMHNRVRMVAASFLVKDLHVDWRRGETVFMQALVDGDPASNNGGWQWVAGTGAHAAPYFRVLNPVRQAQRFDPGGAYIRRWVPELAGVSGARIHEPWRMTPDEQEAAGCVIGVDYPGPVTDHSGARERVLRLYRDARARSSRAPGGHPSPGDDAAV